MSNSEKNTIVKNLVSVIVPTYNRASVISKTLDSVYQQTYRPIEVVIIDDGSTDNTKEVVADWQEKHQEGSFQVKYLIQQNAGAQSARNRGIKNAIGQYLQFLDSDDLIEPQKLKAQVDLMQKENTSICLADYLIVSDQGDIIEKRKRDYSINYIIGHFLSVHTTPPLIDQTHYKPETLHWTENTPKLQDIEFFMKVLMLTNQKSYIPEYLSMWVQHADDRITKLRSYDGKKHYERRVYWRIFKNLLHFYRKNCTDISIRKFFAITRMFIKLIVATIGPGRFVKATRAKLSKQ